MSFSPELWGGCEGAKIAPLIVPYVQGKCLDIGSGPGKVWPSLIGIDTATNNGRPVTDMTMDGTDLSMFADESFDGVFSSFLLHLIDRAKVPAVLAEWTRVIKPGGYLTLYLPNGAELPEERDPTEKWRVSMDDLLSLFPDTKWSVIECEERSGEGEYGLLLVVQKLIEQPRWQRNPGGKKRALVIRYGAIGDAIVTASVFPGLKEQGYHLTVNCRPSTKEVLLHDPYVDEWLVQENDFVPNEMLGPYWQALTERYDRIINLSESVEGLLLALPGRLNHSYAYEARRAIYDHVNYLEHTHNIAAVPYEFSNARFHATGYEKKWAGAVRKALGAGPVIVWCVNGSSAHKVYPWVQIVAAWLLERTPARIVLYGDPGVGKALQKGIMLCLKENGADMSRVLGIAGDWTIRQSLAFLEQADCVVGPETGPMNAAGMLSVPKVIYLSHSSAENLTKHWVNTISLTPPMDRAPCFPCHRLHFDWTHCSKSEETGAAVCASGISPEVVFKAIAEAIIARQAA